MKSFKTFRLDTANHLLYRDGDRVPLAPKAFDLLAYLADNAGRVVTQDEILQALWAETYVNPEVLRKYILEIRKALGDRAEQPEFIETLPKRGYRFIALITDEYLFEPAEAPTPLETERSTEVPIEPEAVTSEPGSAVPERRLGRLALLSILAVVAVALIAVYFVIARRGANAASPKNVSIAVLPFTDMSAANDQEYFSDGLAEQLINDLAKAPGLKVIGRSSAFQFKGKNEDARIVGRKLGVANVLEGSIRRDGNDVRITAELIKTDDGFQIWSQTYDQELKDIFAVQDEIAQSATEALQLKLLGGNGRPFDPTTRSTNPAAYQAYLQAAYFKARGQSKEDLGKAFAHADRAIQLDQKYAPAWALRASTQASEASFDFIDPAEGFRKARNDAERAIELDPTCAAAYLALATTQITHDWDWDAGDTSLRKAAA
jgi:TolB-like protein/DNA-binding winged helix-turn-helix (wHTH) protein